MADAFRAFKARMELYIEDQNVNNRYKQETKLKIAFGDEGMRRFLASGLSDDEKKDPNAVWALIEEQLVQQSRQLFASIVWKAEENISDFVSKLREKATQCKFESNGQN